MNDTELTSNGHSVASGIRTEPKVVRGKRLFDIVVSAAGLVLLAPFLGTSLDGDSIHITGTCTLQGMSGRPGRQRF